MTLEDFKQRIGSIGKNNAYIIDGDDGEAVLKVEWFSEPADYSNRVRELRDEFPQIAQVSAPDGEPERTPDSMPIEYYTEE